MIEKLSEVKILEMHISPAFLALFSIFIIGSAMASEYEFGSKVYPDDSDVGRPLTTFAGLQFPRSIGYWDVGVVPGTFDADDIVYLHFGNPPLPTAPAAGMPIRANDIRLTSYSNHAAGSKVTTTDNDINAPLNALNPPPNAQFFWLDLFGGSGLFDLNDPVLLRVQTPFAPAFPSALNDIRITYSGGMPAGTKLQNSDPDFGKTISGPIFGGPTNPTATVNIQYYDYNGNNVYDYFDDVYLQFMPSVTVKVNNVRLSGPVV